MDFRTEYLTRVRIYIYYRELKSSRFSNLFRLKYVPQDVQLLVSHKHNAIPRLNAFIKHQDIFVNREKSQKSKHTLSLRQERVFGNPSKLHNRDNEI